MSFILHVTVAVQHAGRGLLQVGAVERSRALVPAGPDCQSRSYSGSPHLRQTAHAHRNSILYFIDCLVLLHQTASLIASSCFPFPFLLPFLKLRYRLFSFFFFSDKWINWIEFFFNVFFCVCFVLICTEPFDGSWGTVPTRQKSGAQWFERLPTLRSVASSFAYHVWIQLINGRVQSIQLLLNISNISIKFLTNQLIRTIELLVNICHIRGRVHLHNMQMSGSGGGHVGLWRLPLPSIHSWKRRGSINYSIPSIKNQS